MTIGSQHLTRTASPRQEEAALWTAPGQATWAVPHSPYCCADCFHGAASKMRGKGRCLEYQRRSNGTPGPTLNARQPSCEAFVKKGP
jgi:hypothetical protein